MQDDGIRDDAIALTRGARELAHDRDVAGIAVFTETGRTAVLMSKARPRVPIYAFTPILKTFNRLSMCWGVIPYLIPYASSVESMICIIEESMISSAQIKPGEQIVLIAGLPISAKRPPNLALLHTVGDPCAPLTPRKINYD
jgi:pyruvate kinase